MTQQEMITALITIKRGIYSKPIKTYIDSLILKVRRKTVDKCYYHSAMSYHITQQSFTYGQKNHCKIDVKI